MSLITEKNLEDHDATYATLIAAHKDLSEDESAALNARLILILINHIGDENVVAEALELAKSA